MKLAVIMSLAAAISIAGCSGDGIATFPAGGVVTLDDQPVEGAGVLFMSLDGPAATGTTDAQGRYQLTTGEHQGAAAGPHKVMITLMKTSGIEVAEDGLEGQAATGGIKREYIVPEKYSKVETSGLTAEVGPDKPEHNFALSSK